MVANAEESYCEQRKHAIHDNRVGFKARVFEVTRLLIVLLSPAWMMMMILNLQSLRKEIHPSVSFLEMGSHFIFVS